jgi:hypothetical protein
LLKLRIPRSATILVIYRINCLQTETVSIGQNSATPFTLNPDGVRAVRSRYEKSLRIGAALQLGFLRMCGRPLTVMQRVPRELLQHPGIQLRMPALDIVTLRAIYQRRRGTLLEQQSWTIAYLGMRRFQFVDAAEGR